jgi:L-threonylcarbamoyladenylate synthase
MKQIKTDIVLIDPIHPAEVVIERASALLRQGELVVFPTETVYGLGADAFQRVALEGIFIAKGRPFNDPLIVHIAELAELAALTLTSSIPEVVWQLARTFWPGPLTLILPCGPRVPQVVTAGMATVAVRMPSHPVARALIRSLGSPIAAPSANRFMHISPTTAQHALADLDGRVPLILDGGPCVVGVESTILDLSASIPTVLRPGGVSLEALRAVLPEVCLPDRRLALADEQAQKAPGQLSTHYAPAIPLIVFDGSEEAMRTAILAELHRRMAHGERVGILVADADLPTFQESSALIYTLGDASNPAQVASALFASLRTLEEAQVQVILCRNFSAHDLGLAIRDRLGRAAGGQVIQV